VWKGTHNIQVKVTTQHADETTWIDRPSKRWCHEKKVTCGNLYEGTTGILAAGTSPFMVVGWDCFPLQEWLWTKCIFVLDAFSHWWDS
jgi:hypothetical protein